MQPSDKTEQLPGRKVPTPIWGLCPNQKTVGSRAGKAATSPRSTCGPRLHWGNGSHTLSSWGSWEGQRAPCEKCGNARMSAGMADGQDLSRVCHIPPTPTPTPACWCHPRILCGLQEATAEARRPQDSPLQDSLGQPWVVVLLTSRRALFSYLIFLGHPEACLLRAYFEGAQKSHRTQQFMCPGHSEVQVKDR